MTLTETIHSEIKEAALKLRKAHQNTDLAILEQAVTLGADLILRHVTQQITATRADLEKQRRESNRQQ